MRSAKLRSIVYSHGVSDADRGVGRRTDRGDPSGECLIIATPNNVIKTQDTLLEHKPKGSCSSIQFYFVS
jgi:hypothetical protein